MEPFKFEFRENDAKRLFRPLAYDSTDHLYICDDNTLAFSFVCTPASGWDTQMLSTVGLLLNDPYPSDSMLSFSLWASPDIKPHLTASDYLRRSCKDALLKSSQDTALGMYWGGTSNPSEVIQQTKVRDFQLVVTYKMPVESIDPSEDEMESIRNIQSRMQQRLSKSYLNPRAMTRQMLLNMMNAMLHWKPNAEWRTKQNVELDETRTLNDQFLQTDVPIFKEQDGVVFGAGEKATHCKMLTVRRFPKKTRVGTAFKWFGDPFDGQGCVTQNFIITVNVHYPEHLSVKNKVEGKNNNYIKMSRGSLSTFAPKISEMRADLKELLEAISGESRAVKVSLSAMVFGKNEKDAEQGRTDLQSHMKQCGLAMTEEDSFAIPSLINSLPFGACVKAAKESQRYWTLGTKHVLPILPMFAEWKGTGTPMLNFVSRTGQIMSVDIFDSVTNYNTLIYAESGAGKSFLTNEIIRAYMSTGGNVWAIDAGESYKKTSKFFNGTFTAFNEDADLSLNPFTMIPEDDPRAFNDSVEMLAGCILAMAFKRDKPSDYQVSEVERVLGEVWAEKGRNALIDDVAKKLLNQTGPDAAAIRQVGTQLYAFTTEGRFGHYFDKPHNVEFNGSFNVLELDGLQNTPQLQAVVLFMLIVQISHAMYSEYKKDRSVKRLVIIDEAWDLLGNSLAVAEFMEKGFRRFRKYNGAGIIVTQSIKDLQTSEAGRAIAENAANSLILKQKEATITAAEKDDLMSLPKAGYRLLKKVKTETGHYSEIFFNTNRGMGIGRLIVDPMRVLMYSTKAQDNQEIDDYVRSGLPLDESILRVAHDRRMMRYPMPRPEFLDYSKNQLRNEFLVDAYLGASEDEEAKIFKAMDDHHKALTREAANEVAEAEAEAEEEQGERHYG